MISAKKPITGRLMTNSMPFEQTWRSTHMVRGIFTERISLPSERNARVASEMLPLNHVQGSRPASRNTMYGSSLAPPRWNTKVKTTQ